MQPVAQPASKPKAQPPPPFPVTLARTTLPPIDPHLFLWPPHSSLSLDPPPLFFLVAPNQGDAAPAPCLPPRPARPTPPRVLNSGGHVPLLDLASDLPLSASCARAPPLPPPSAELRRLCARAPCSTSSSPPLEPHRLGLAAGSSFCCCILSPTPLRAPPAPSSASPATWAFIPVFPASSVPPSCLCPLRAAAARRSAPWPLAPSSSCGSLTFLRHFALVF